MGDSEECNKSGEANIIMANQSGTPGGTYKVTKAFDLLISEGKKAMRFNVIITEEESQRQLAEREKYLNMCKLEAFNPRSEVQLEDWVDRTAGVVSRNRLGVSLFHELLLLFLHPLRSMSSTMTTYSDRGNNASDTRFTSAS
eukprot:GHVS01052882.1.p1 GENE.GHVS01052882.1~~GHVS01052882.1.p1  ORF type:complete len:142 (+),score=12.12 GHVS01052882.1:208-633(+)